MRGGIISCAAMLILFILLDCHYAKAEKLKEIKADISQSQRTEACPDIAAQDNKRQAAGLAKDESDKGGKIAELVLKSTEEKYKASQDRWDMATKIIGAIIGLGVLAVSITAFLGYKDIHDIKAKLPEFDALRNRTLESLAQHETEAKLIGHALRASVSALRETTIAFRISGEALNLAKEAKNPALTATERRKKQREALNMVQRIERLVLLALTEEDEIVKRGDKSVLGWAYQIRGFAVGEASRLTGRDTLGGFAQALTWIEKGLGLAPDQGSGWYNAACYAGLTNEREKAITYLRKAISLDPDNAQEAALDDDFATLREMIEFEMLTRQEYERPQST